MTPNNFLFFKRTLCPLPDLIKVRKNEKLVKWSYWTCQKQERNVCEFLGSFVIKNWYSLVKISQYWSYVPGRDVSGERVVWDSTDSAKTTVKHWIWCHLCSCAVLVNKDKWIHHVYPSRSLGQWQMKISWFSVNRSRLGIWDKDRFRVPRWEKSLKGISKSICMSTAFEVGDRSKPKSPVLLSSDSYIYFLFSVGLTFTVIIKITDSS